MTVQHDITAPAGEARASAQHRTRGARLLSIGGILGGLAAGSCCVVPFVLVTVGISGAWIGNLTALAPYKPIFVALTLAVLGACLGKGWDDDLYGWGCTDCHDAPREGLG